MSHLRARVGVYITYHDMAGTPLISCAGDTIIFNPKSENYYQLQCTPRESARNVLGHLRLVLGFVDNVLVDARTEKTELSKRGSYTIRPATHDELLVGIVDHMAANNPVSTL